MAADEGARLYDYHERDRVAKRIPGEDTRKYMARLVGSRLPAVDAARIERFLKAANDTQPSFCCEGQAVSGVTRADQPEQAIPVKSRLAGYPAGGTGVRTQPRERGLLRMVT